MDPAARVSLSCSIRVAFLNGFGNQSVATHPVSINPFGLQYIWGFKMLVTCG